MLEWASAHGDAPRSLPAVLAAQIGKPNVAIWGTGNRICAWCSNAPETFPDDNAYSLHYGVAGTPEHSGLPAQPKVLDRREGDGDRVELVEREFTARGFIISNYPWV